MKKASEILKELGFNSQAEDSVKEAFVKYLIKQSTGLDVQTPSEKKLIAENPEKVVPFPNQLEFQFDDSGTTVKKNTKTS